MIHKNHVILIAHTNIKINKLTSQSADLACLLAAESFSSDANLNANANAPGCVATRILPPSHLV